MTEYCPNCGEMMDSGDSGEPECIPGWWCPECREFWTDEEISDIHITEDLENDNLQ